LELATTFLAQEEIMTDPGRERVAHQRRERDLKARVRALARHGVRARGPLKPEHDPELERRIAIVRAWKAGTGREGAPARLTEEVLARLLPD
jgi:hypothetical protein